MLKGHRQFSHLLSILYLCAPLPRPRTQHTDLGTPNLNDFIILDQELFSTSGVSVGPCGRALPSRKGAGEALRPPPNPHPLFMGSPGKCWGSVDLGASLFQPCLLLFRLGPFHDARTRKIRCTTSIWIYRSNCAFGAQAANIVCRRVKRFIEHARLGLIHLDRFLILRFEVCCTSRHKAQGPSYKQG